MAYRRRTRRAPVRRYRRRAPVRRVRRALVRRRAVHRRYPRAMSGAVSYRMARRMGAAPRRYGQRRVMSVRPMSAHTNRRGDIVVEKTEYLFDLTSSATASAFSGTAFAVNPGLSSANGGAFSWLNGIANQFEEWDPVYCEIIFKSTSANALNSTNTALGTVGITPLYNTFSSTSLGSKVAAESYDGACSGVTSKSLLLKLQTKNSRNPLDTYFTRSGAVPANQTASMTDLCNVVVWTQGLQGTSVVVGEVWIRYKIILKSPKPGALLGSSVAGAHYTASSGVSTSHYFGTGDAPTQSAGSNMVWTFTGTTAIGPATIAPGKYEITYVTNGGATGGAVGPTIAYTTNCSAANITNASASAQYAVGNPTGTWGITTVFVNVTGPSPVLTFSGAIFPSSANIDFIVTQLPTGLV